MSDESAVRVRSAEARDLDGVLAIQEEDQPENGGTLSARFSREWFAQAAEDEFLIVAEVGDRVAGYVAFTPREAQAHVGVVRAMLRAHPDPGAYLHGPICVGREFRRRGLAVALFRAHRERMHGAPVMAFIRADNVSSRAAHVGMGMREVAEFECDGVRYVVVAA
ncbi:GNAT family N-acetyltransferase [Geodermatophilus sabuli]|uniref:GNAT family N-acetyltransferase n=1 Tax=Geodermatophilus sabuli TaxID=1564158 RepID=A0A7K3W5S9_9ACTN|nr:GNAT family N-acetyltransferase [Geodermatophilus sabuli]